ncbi:MAG: ribosome assembly RNA-binding protein YhbY [Mahellales bacterium]|jgi:RNA-binding protein
MLSNKQRNYLRVLANRIDPIFQIGKAGINDNLIIQIDDALEAREIIKISVLKNSELDVKEACRELAHCTDSEPVQVIGNKFVLYRESREHKKIQLD